MVCTANHYYWTLRPIKVNLCSSFICAALIREHKTFKWCSGLSDKNTFRTILIFFCVWAKGMYLIRYARKDSDCVFCAMITSRRRQIACRGPWRRSPMKRSETSRLLTSAKLKMSWTRNGSKMQPSKQSCLQWYQWWWNNLYTVHGGTQRKRLGWT